VLYTGIYVYIVRPVLYFSIFVMALYGISVVLNYLNAQYFAFLLNLSRRPYVFAILAVIFVLGVYKKPAFKK